MEYIIKAQEILVIAHEKVNMKRSMMNLLIW